MATYKAAVSGVLYSALAGTKVGDSLIAATANRKWSMVRVTSVIPVNENECHVLVEVQIRKTNEALRLIYPVQQPTN